MAEINGQIGDEGRGFYHRSVRHPGFTFTSDASFPNKIKLRKKFNFWPLIATIGGDYNLRTEEFQPRFTVKDAILRGRICLEPKPGNHTLRYRKSISAAVGRVDFHAEVSYPGALNPRWGIQYHFGGSCMLEGRNGLLLKQKVPFSKNFAVEVCGRLNWPMPIAAFRHQDGVNECSVGEGNFNFNLSETNAIIKL